MCLQMVAEFYSLIYSYGIPLIRMTTQTWFEYCNYCIAANHSDFGGILPIFKQYSAIPIGMTGFRQNLKKLCYVTVKTRLKIARRFILLNMYCASVASCKYCLGDTAAGNGICDWLVGVLLPNE